MQRLLGAGKIEQQIKAAVRLSEGGLPHSRTPQRDAQSGRTLEERRQHLCRRGPGGDAAAATPTEQAVSA